MLRLPPDGGKFRVVCSGAAAFLAAEPGVATLADASPNAGAPLMSKETHMSILGITTMSEAGYAILEEDGHVSVIPRRPVPA
jgi:hypothetical protein